MAAPNREIGFGIVFTPEQREQLREGLVEAAREDDRITGAALTGSAAVGREDRWSDIDLALCLSDGADADQVVTDWTERMYRDHGAVHHLDVRHRNTLFRVFLLGNSLQVDLGFWPPTEFGATGPTFRLLFGTAVQRPPAQPPEAENLIGMAWLYALHARASIARGRVWQAEYMISGMRDQVLALRCLRHARPAVQARGIDDLPEDAALAETLVRSLDLPELGRAFAVTTKALLHEIEQVDENLAIGLKTPLIMLSS
jgi:predicted nucleotidyltransferase